MTPEQTTVETFVLWVVALSTFFNFAALIWNVFSGPSRKNAAALEKLIHQMSSHETRLASLEQAQKTMPTKDDFHALQLNMVKIVGDVDRIGVILGRVDATVNRYVNYLRGENNS